MLITWEGQIASHSLQAMHLRFIKQLHKLPLLSTGISTKAVLASHSRRNGDLFVGEVHGELLSAHGHDRHPKTTEHISEEQVLAGALQNYESILIAFKYSCSRE